jgi:hypothetical protein
MTTTSTTTATAHAMATASTAATTTAAAGDQGGRGGAALKAGLSGMNHADRQSQGAEQQSAADVCEGRHFRVTSQPVS